jgi:addiction module HigA family antidote
MPIQTDKPSRPPTRPGLYIKEDILDEFGLTQAALADALKVSRRTINQLVNGKRAVTPEVALKLARFTGTSAEFWLNLQRAVDLWEAGQRTVGALAAIKPLETAGVETG